MEDGAAARRLWSDAWLTDCQESSDFSKAAESAASSLRLRSLIRMFAMSIPDYRGVHAMTEVAAVGGIWLDRSQPTRRAQPIPRYLAVHSAAAILGDRHARVVRAHP
jgi:hypothetical protein